MASIIASFHIYLIIKRLNSSFCLWAHIKTSIYFEVFNIFLSLIDPLPSLHEGQCVGENMAREWLHIPNNHPRRAIMYKLSKG